MSTCPRDELAYIGFASNTRASRGWRDASALGISLEVGAVLAAEDSELLAQLMGATGRDAVEFLA